MILIVIVGANAGLRAQTPAEILFDIPVQPMASALEAYSAATGRMAAYNGSLAVGRVSAEVKGRLTAQAALQLLLKDSGLVAEDTTLGAFVVLAGPEHVSAAATPFNIARNGLSQQNAQERRFSGIMQGSINDALCAQPQTMPGSYRLAINFRVGSDGQLQQLKLLSSTGDRGRDQILVNQLRAVSIGESPPQQMPQPFTMVVLPSSSGGAHNCPSMENARHG